ncbi:MAG: TolC family protein [Acidobacteria bacterium]|nr:TolC family protein [Acidobacteriota bacterium]
MKPLARAAALATLVVGACFADRLTLDQALELADRHHPRLREADAERAITASAIETARAYPNPIFDTTLARQNARMAGVPTGGYQYYIFTQPLDLPSVRRPRIQTAELGWESSQLAQQETRLAVRTSVRHSFYESLRWRSTVDLARQSLELIEELRRRIGVQVDVGEAGRLELIRAEAEVATARSVVNRAQLEYVTAISRLRAAIGASHDSVLEPVGKIQDPPPLPPLATLLQEVSKQYPSLAQAQTEVRRAESHLQTELALRKPQPSVRFEFEQLPDSTLYRFAVAAPIPLWNRRKGPIGEARATVQRAEATVDRRLIEIRAALENAYGRYQIAGQQIDALQGGVLREAEEAVRSSQVAYQLGERGIVDVLDAQRVLRTVRLDFLNAQYDRQSALNDIRHLRALDLTETP